MEKVEDLEGSKPTNANITAIEERLEDRKDEKIVPNQPNPQEQRHKRERSWCSFQKVIVDNASGLVESQR